MGRYLLCRKPKSASISAAIVFGFSLANLITLSNCKSINGVQQSLGSPLIHANHHSGLSLGDLEQAKKLASVDEKTTRTNQQAAQWIPIRQQSIKKDGTTLAQQQVGQTTKSAELKQSLVATNSSRSNQESSGGCNKEKRDVQAKPQVAAASVHQQDIAAISGGEDANDDDEDNQFEHEDEPAHQLMQSNKNTAARKQLANRRNATDSIQASGSVALESSVIPPSMDDNDSDQYSPQSNDDDEQQTEDAGQASKSAKSRALNYDNNRSDDNDNDTEASKTGQSATDEEAIARREQEAAEASEAEAADRSALDEQQQAQREIILALARSEAKAIKEQQEALLRQQQLQQQILMRRHQNDLSHHDELRNNKKGAYGEGPMTKKERSKIYHADKSNRNSHRPSESNAINRKRHNGGLSSKRLDELYETPSSKHQHLAATASTRTRQREYVANDVSKRPMQMDIQFSDHPDHGIDNGSENERNPDETISNAVPVPRSLDNNGSYDSRDTTYNSDSSYSKENLGDELGGGYSTRRTQYINSPVASMPSFIGLTPAPVGIRYNLTEGDLIAAAQHHYGAHYDSLQGHHGEYYQYTESKKKGQFDSGFKRGGKKLSTSGHSSQNKGHAEGHVKWSSKKGKGSHYWDLKHKNKKHYGMGGGYGGGHSFY